MRGRYRFAPVARARQRDTRPLPPPLPPGERTVGQVVAEAVRLYGRRFWPSLALGIPVALVNGVPLWVEHSLTRLVVLVALGPALLAAAYVAACLIATDAPRDRRRVARAYVAGLAIFIPLPLLMRVYLLPGLVWLAFLGLAVPAVLVEGAGLREAFRRAVRLARADFVHVLGGLAALVIVLFVTQAALYAALKAQGEQSAQAAGFIAGVVVSPVLFLGAALLYFDQAARIGSRRQPTRRNHADLPDAHHAHREGRPDAEGESRPPA